MIEAREYPGGGNPPIQKSAERKHERQRLEEKRFDARHARFRVYQIECERTRGDALTAIAEREALRRRRRDLARTATFVHGVSHGPLGDPLGPHDSETLSAFLGRIDRETPRLRLSDFDRIPAWYDSEFERPNPRSIPGSMPALRGKRSRA